MSAPEKIFVTVEYIGKTDTVVCGAFGTYPMDESVEFTRTDLSQAAVAAALEAAAGAIRKRGQTEIETAHPPLGASTQAFYEAYDIIRALITPAQHDALAAHVAAEVVAAGVDEYLLEDRLAGKHEQHGRRVAVRGLMVRMGAYDQFCSALSATDEDSK